MILPLTLGYYYTFFDLYTIMIVFHGDLVEMCMRIDCILHLLNCKNPQTI